PALNLEVLRDGSLPGFRVSLSVPDGQIFRDLPDVVHMSKLLMGPRICTKVFQA
ncbi:unnamed protein product, partial [Caretta caretta]